MSRLKRTNKTAHGRPTVDKEERKAGAGGKKMGSGDQIWDNHLPYAIGGGGSSRGCQDRLRPRKGSPAGQAVTREKNSGGG